MVLLDGYALARLKEEALRHEVQTLQQTLQLCPKLVVVLVGTDNASVLYVNMKAKACVRVGINCIVESLPEQTPQEELLNLLDTHNQDKSVHGILVQLPLPKHIDTRRVIEAIAPHKDVDGFHPLNVGRVYSNSLYTGFLPATAMGVMQLLKHYNIEVKRKDVAIVGASNIIGKPLASLMLNAGATISLCHILTKDISLYTKKADIVCVGVGQPKLLKADMVKEGAVVVDIGINKVEGKVVGDADFESLKDKVSFITPVPRGVGPMTIACLLQNTLHAAKGCA
ncbi:Bifunctional 5,10-methylene-tetrahydrofolate dehydrogenase [Helicobacter sp. NHP21005]|uniref:bifunctional 5,10-methylenetetrahydrofolate dehydrogenase/5,10-methenyltetrahydrofolate cyclohydrolase n=1 Tax=Helicobacter felistomachi TaxID=3040201 RepID=UPI0025723F44|nr:tetrahydrofolate dehydrogenase/cyclohydrolase catalytic domain-containing protein [Helicobacter sp. NHP21005]BEG57819.1 Bifunctional 5,10-methylene-tetrahydrofolate dehydrogenase [Helicobacter sp. NHP21005]